LVIAILNKDFIPVRVHSDVEKEIVLRYNIRALPNIAFISEHGTRIGMNLIQALVWNVGTLHVMVRENSISEAHEGEEYRCS